MGQNVFSLDLSALVKKERGDIKWGIRKAELMKKKLSQVKSHTFGNVVKPQKLSITR